MSSVIKAQFHTEIYSPRWGHNDRWSFTPTNTGWIIQSGPHSRETGPDGIVRVVESEYSDFGLDWKDHWIQGLPEMLTNDHIHAPNSIHHFLSQIWTRLNSGNLSTDEATRAFEVLGEWISTTTKSMPNDPAIQKLH